MEVINKLDKMASHLEDMGCIKEAMEIDMVSNTIEKWAYTLDSDGKVKSMKLAINFLNKKNLDFAKNTLVSIKEPWRIFIQVYGNRIPDVESAYLAYRGALDMLTMGYDISSTPEKAIEYLNKSVAHMEKAAPIISREQVVRR